ncbi:MAG: hypothetical protein WD029_03730 [Microthrixaceae bacterium]
MSQDPDDFSPDTTQGFMNATRSISMIREISSLGGFGRAWSVGIVLFSVLRALLAWPTLSRYGVNPWLFLGLDLITAPPYGVGQAVTVKILRDQTRPPRDAVLWAAVVAVMFFAPYAYIFLASGEMPALAYVGLILWILLFAGLSVFRMARQVRAPRETQSSQVSGSQRTAPNSHA